MRLHLLAAVLPVLAVTSGSAVAQPAAASRVDDFAGKPRLVVLTDVGNEPDDQMSFVRLLLYSNEIDLEALVATTSCWQRAAVHPETLRTLIAAYGEVRPRLLEHASGWPEASALLALVAVGPSQYGMAAVSGGQPLSAGAEAIVKAADRPDPRPLWIAVWGGASTLAQALSHVRSTRAPADVDRFVDKLRVYSISDQDDAGPWIRREFPGLSYVAAPSNPDSGEYYYATWTGISGDVYYRNCAGADPALVTNEWLDQHVRARGPLGQHYPRFAFIMEGDTPSFLGLINNGLNSYRNSGWGGWGGRYVFRQPHGEPHAIWTQGGDLFSRVTSQDTVIGADGRTYTSDQATVWRWREAYQNDFAARMAWTVEPYARANHNPVLTVNGDTGTAPIVIDVEVGQPVTLDASASRDPDGQALRYRWFHYAEAGLAPGRGLAAITIAQADASRAVVTATAACRPNWFGSSPRCDAGVAHVILAVTDSGSPALTGYRRVILNVRNSR